MDDDYEDVYPFHNRVSNRYAWDVKSSTGYVGLESKVTPSYLTGVLQILFHNMAFRRFVFSWPYSEWIEKRLHQPSDMSVMERLNELDQKSVMVQLQRLFARMQVLSERLTKTGPFLFALGKGETHDVFGKLEVEDFLEHLFNRMDQECEGTALQGRLDELVRVRVNTILCCKECGSETKFTSREACWKLDLEFVDETNAKRHVSDLVTCVHLFLTINDVPDHVCKTCNRQVSAVCRKELDSTPLLMFVLLNRFVFMENLQRRSKHRFHIEFPEKLSMQEFLPDEELVSLDYPDAHFSLPPREEFFLKGAVIHAGVSDHGIFSAMVMPVSIQPRDKWFLFAENDIEEVYDVNRQMQIAYGRKSMHNEEDECAFLLAYVKDCDNHALLQPASINDIPDYLVDLVRNEHAARVDRKRKKAMDREMQKVDVLYNGEIRQLRLHGSTTLDAATDMAAALFQLDLPRTHFRLRKWDNHYKVPNETYGNRPNATIASCRFYPSDMLMIETLRSNQAAFVEYDTSCFSVRVELYDAQSNSFGKHHVVTIPRRTDSLLVLKRILATEFGIPVTEQRIFKEASTGASDSASTVEVIGDNEELSYKLQVWEGSTLYLEHSDAQPSDPSPCQQEIDRVKNRATLSYWFDGRETVLQVDRRDRLYTFKAQVAEREKLEVDRFKVFQVFAVDVAAELKNEDQTLNELLPSAANAHHAAARDTSKIRIERFVPRSADRVAISFVVVSGPDRSKVEQLGPVEEVSVSTPVAELKVQLAKRLGEQRLEGKFIRLRELECGGELGNILAEPLTLKDAVDVLYSNKVIGVELIGRPDTKKSRDVVVVSVVRSHGNWTLSPPVELTLQVGSSMDALVETVAHELKLPVDVVGLAKATGTISALDVPHLDWNARAPNFIRAAGVQRDTVESSPFYLKDGDQLVVRDNTEAIQDLTDEQRISLMRR